MFKKTIAMLFMVLFIISLGATTSFGEGQKEVIKETLKQETKEIITGTISSIDLDNRKIVISDGPHKKEMVISSAISELTIKKLSKGDNVTIECCDKNVIRSIKKI